MKRGYFGIGVFHGKNEQNIGTLWRSANIMGADFIFTIGKRYSRQCTDTMKTPRHMSVAIAELRLITVIDSAVIADRR